MQYFNAVYQVSSVKYSSFIYADGLQDARELAKVRSIGEEVIGVLSGKPRGFEPQPLPSILYQQRNLPACCHTLTFYSWIACRSKVTDFDHTLCDDGLIHEVTHELEFPTHFSFRPTLFTRLRALEHEIPGLKVPMDMNLCKCLERLNVPKTQKLSVD